MKSISSWLRSKNTSSNVDPLRSIDLRLEGLDSAVAKLVLSCMLGSDPVRSGGSSDRLEGSPKYLCSDNAGELLTRARLPAASGRDV